MDDLDNTAVSSSCTLDEQVTGSIPGRINFRIVSKIDLKIDSGLCVLSVPEVDLTNLVLIVPLKS